MIGFFDALKVAMSNIGNVFIRQVLSRYFFAFYIDIGWLVGQYAINKGEILSYICSCTLRKGDTMRNLGVALTTVTVSFFSASLRAESQSFQFIQQNTLDTEDAAFTTNVSEDDFNAIISAALDAYSGDAQARGETLVINRNWDDSTVNANCARRDGTVTINMYGGMARRNEINVDAFALVLCHEIGHAYGGMPYIRPALQIAAEGQADYYGMQECMRRLLSRIPVDANSLSPDELVSERCNASQDPQLCTRELIAGEHIAHLFAALKHTDVPNYTTPDKTVVAQTELSYPKTLQCRIDTYYNAALQTPRPACWYHQ